MQPIYDSKDEANSIFLNPPLSAAYHGTGIGNAPKQTNIRDANNRRGERKINPTSAIFSMM